MQTAREAFITLQLKQISLQVVTSPLQTIHNKTPDQSTKIRITKLLDKVKKEFKDGDMSNNAVES